MSTAFHERSSFSVVFLCEANIGKVQPLTHSFVRDYPGAQVLVTPKQKRCIASDIVIFLRPLFYSMVGRAKNTTPEMGIIPPTFCRLLTPDHPHFADGQIPSKEQKIMKHATKAPTKRAQSTRFPEHFLRCRHLLYFDHDGNKRSTPIDSDADISKSAKNWTEWRSIMEGIIHHG